MTQQDRKASVRISWRRGTTGATLLLLSLTLTIRFRTVAQALKSRQDLLDDVAVNVGQPEVAPGSSFTRHQQPQQSSLFFQQGAMLLQ